MHGGVLHGGVVHGGVLHRAALHRAALHGAVPHGSSRRPRRRVWPLGPPAGLQRPLQAACAARIVAPWAPSGPPTAVLEHVWRRRRTCSQEASRRPFGSISGGSAETDCSQVISRRPWGGSPQECHGAEILEKAAGRKSSRRPRGGCLCSFSLASLGEAGQAGGAGGRTEQTDEEGRRSRQTEQADGEGGTDGRSGRSMTDAADGAVGAGKSCPERLKVQRS